MKSSSLGLWLIGAWGGVGTTVALGLSALGRKKMEPIGLVTALPLFEKMALDELDRLVLGGHEIRRTSFARSVEELQQRSGIFGPELVNDCRPDLERWNENIRPGTALHAGPTIEGLAELPETRRARTARETIEAIQKDLREFQEKHRLSQVVVVNVASTEPPFAVGEAQQSCRGLLPLLEKKDPVLPPSALYAWAALDLGFPYINFTPSLGASFPAIQELAQQRQAVYGGQDGKTGETLLKTVLAPMFALRNWQVLSWVGHNIFGNRDGLVLNDPVNKASKVQSKDRVVTQVLGYKPQTHVSIEYIESLDDWKTAWDHIHFQGFLGVKMIMQFIWQGCDSILAAPLVLDLARLALFAQRQREVGVLRHLACFFKNPMGVEEHDFFRQFSLLEEYVRRHIE